jgi:hypothetical protein
MELCVLDPTVPNPNVTVSGFDPAIKISPHSVVDIWLLDGSQELSRHILWTHAPPRQQHFGKIGFSGKESHRLEFSCPSMSFTTFEFTCAPETPECHVEFWQKKAEPPNGLCVFFRLCTTRLTRFTWQESTWSNMIQGRISVFYISACASFRYLAWLSKSTRSQAAII